MLLRLTTTRVSRLYKGGKHIDEVTGVADPAHSFCPEDWLDCTGELQFLFCTVAAGAQ